MRISLKRHGGLAAVVKRPPTRLDTAALEAGVRSEVEALAHAVSRQAPPTALPRPDEGSYALTIEDGERSVELDGTDTTRSAELAKLMQLVERHGNHGHA